MAWYDEGHEPDYRFSLANERTFLAWMRTALALLAGGVLLHQFATRIQPPWLLAVLSAALVFSAGALAVGGYLQWRANQAAMRNDRGLPRTPLIATLATMVAVLSAATALVLLVQ